MLLPFFFFVGGWGVWLGRERGVGFSLLVDP